VILRQLKSQAASDDAAANDGDIYFLAHKMNLPLLR
jgi:hypothetical protein